MNRVILMGRLTRDPEVRYTQGERSMAVARYTLAFDRAGEFAEKYFRQGMRVLVSGRIQTGSYTNKEGQRVYTTDIIADDQEFADSKNASAGGKQAPEMGKPIGDGFMSIPDGVEDERLPFN